jgi:hypothetical protein
VIAKDKLLHLVAGFFCGPLAPVAGLLKELRDRKGYGTYDPRDFWWTVLGGVLSSPIWLYLIW